MLMNKFFVFAVLTILLNKICNGAKLSFDAHQNNKLNRNNNHSPLATRLVHQLKKRSTSRCPSYPNILLHFQANQCLRTLSQYKKYECKHSVTNEAKHLEIENWPQAQASCKQCIDNYNHILFHTNLPASTIVRVWNFQLKTWQKIKVTVGHYCSKRPLH